LVIGEGVTGNAFVRSHRDLEVWQKAMNLAVEIYRATEAMPKSEIYGLTGQIRRAATSIPANIAEGSGRRTTRDLLHFLSIAAGSLREVDTFLELIDRLNFDVNTPPLFARCEEVGRLLSGLTRSLSRKVP
jgi:four helix bundle protein